MSYTILYVDHDAERAESLRGHLEEKGYRWLAADSGEAALVSLEQHRPDLIVVDADVEDEVADLCQALRSAEPDGQVAPLVVSGDLDASEDAVSRLAQSGCDLLVEKPITVDRLLGLCRDLLLCESADDSDDASSDLPAADGDDGETAEIGANSTGGDGLLDPASVLSALGRLDSMVDDGDSEHDGADPSDDPSSDDTVRARAAARGDFSQLLEDVNLDQPPTHAIGLPDEGEVPTEEAGEEVGLELVETPEEISANGEAVPVQTAEHARDDAVAHAAGPVEARHGGREGEGGDAGDEGRDIEDHLDSLFSGAAPATQAPAERSSPPVTRVELPEPAIVPGSDAPTPFDAPSDLDEEACPDHATTDPDEESAEPVEAFAEPTVRPPAEVAEAPAPEPVESEAPATPTYRRDDTAPVPAPRRTPEAHELFDPQEVEPALSRLDARKTGKSWIVAAVVGLVLVGTAIVWFAVGRDPGAPAGDALVALGNAAKSPTATRTDGGGAARFTPVDTTSDATVDAPAGAGDTVDATAAGSAPLDTTSSAAATKPAPLSTRTPSKSTTKTGATSAPDTAATSRPAASADSSRATRTKSAEPSPGKSTSDTSTTTGSRTDVPAVAAPATAPSATSARPADTTVRTGAPAGDSATTAKPETVAAASPSASPASAEPDDGTVSADLAAATPRSEPPPTPTPAADSAQATAATSRGENPAPTPTGGVQSAAPSASTSSTAGGTTNDSESAAARVADTEPTVSGAGSTETETAAHAEPIQPVEDVRVPVVLSRVEPQVSAKTLKKGGTVVLKVLVNEHGGISRVLVERGIPGSDAEGAAINAVLRWKFQPATRQGEPIRAWSKVTFDFD